MVIVQNKIHILTPLLLLTSCHLFVSYKKEKLVSKNVLCRRYFHEFRFKTWTMFCGQNIILNTDLRWNPCFVFTMLNLDWVVNCVHWTFITYTIVICRPDIPLNKMFVNPDVGWIHTPVDTKPTSVYTNLSWNLVKTHLYMRPCKIWAPYCGH